MAIAFDTTKPIPTAYGGVMFRSRLEARYARFFDALNEPWLCEPEGFAFVEAGHYLPDFFLPRAKTWLEIKPIVPSASERRKCSLLCQSTGQRVILAHGQIGFWLDVQQARWNPESALAWVPSAGPSGEWGAIEQSRYFPCVCSGCGRFGFEFEGDGGNVCSGLGIACDGGPQPEKSYTFADARIVTAARMANAESFWG